MLQNLFVFAKENKLGTVTLVLSLAFTFLGLPIQIWTIWKAQDIQSVSPLMFSLLAIQCLFWVLYGIQKRDRFVIVANTPGFIFGIIIVTEWFYFRF